jgi:hypothetical protein
LLMTHPGVGPITALATDVFPGDAARAEEILSESPLALV